MDAGAQLDQVFVKEGTSIVRVPSLNERRKSRAMIWGGVSAVGGFMRDAPYLPGAGENVTHKKSRTGP